MKICSRCAKSFEDDVDFCNSCGIKLMEVQLEEDEQHEQPYENIDYESEDSDDEAEYSEFVDNDEQIVAELGSSYLKNIISEGKVSDVSAVLTQKRLYLDGKTYLISGKSLTAIKESRIINVEDITGTGFVYFSNITFILISIIILIASIIVSVMELEALGVIGFFVAVFFFIAYFLNRVSIFRIEYAGGSIGFKVEWDSRKASENFQKEIIRVKDRRRKEIVSECLKAK